MTARKVHFNVHSLVEKAVWGSREERRKADRQLELIGSEYLGEVFALTNSRDPEVRREAADLLGRIGDKAAVACLIELLEDPELEVRWRAAESLVVLGRDSVVPLLEALLQKKRFGSVRFLDGAHHILRRLDDKGYIGPSREVLEALEGPYREETVPWAAERALSRLGVYPKGIAGQRVHTNG